MQLFVRNLSARSVVVDVDACGTVAQLKTAVQVRMQPHAGVSYQRTLRTPCLAALSLFSMCVRCCVNSCAGAPGLRQHRMDLPGPGACRQAAAR